MASPSRLPSTRRPTGASGGRSRPVSMIEPGFAAPESPAQDAATSKSAKRRSLLPQLSRAGSGEFKEGADAGRENEDPEEGHNDGLDGAPAEGTRQADRNAMPPPSKLSRPSSMRMPGTSQLGRAPSTRSHTRTQSKETSTASTRHTPSGSSSGIATARPSSRSAGSESGLQRSSSIKQPQQPTKTTGLARSSSIRAPQAPLHARTSSAAITATSKRQSVSNGRPSSISTSVGGQPSSRAPPSPTKADESRPSGRTSMAPPPRPSFNTFQQHYSPAKSGLPKPPLPSARQSRTSAAPPAEEDTTVSFEVSKQQNELLQLSLIHQASSKSLQQYIASGKRKVGRKHAKLRKELELALAAEQDHQRVANLDALQAWCPDPAFLAENLQLLARIYRDVTTVTHSDSRYSRLLQTFENWIASTEPGSTDQQGAFFKPLSGQWREAHASVALKIRSLQREMATLPPLPTPPKNHTESHGTTSSLEQLMTSCRALIDGTLRELDMMSKLEYEILDSEKARIDSAVAALTLEDVEGGGAGEDWRPAWQKAG